MTYVRPRLALMPLVFLLGACRLDLFGSESNTRKLEVEVQADPGARAFTDWSPLRDPGALTVGEESFLKIGHVLGSLESFDAVGNGTGERRFFVPFDQIIKESADRFSFQLPIDAQPGPVRLHLVGLTTTTGLPTVESAFDTAATSLNLVSGVWATEDGGGSNAGSALPDFVIPATSTQEVNATIRLSNGDAVSGMTRSSLSLRFCQGEANPDAMPDPGYQWIRMATYVSGQDDCSYVYGANAANFDFPNGTRIRMRLDLEPGKPVVHYPWTDLTATNSSAGWDFPVILGTSPGNRYPGIVFETWDPVGQATQEYCPIYPADNDPNFRLRNFGANDIIYAWLKRKGSGPCPEIPAPTPTPNPAPFACDSMNGTACVVSSVKTLTTFANLGKIQIASGGSLVFNGGGTPLSITVTDSIEIMDDGRIEGDASITIPSLTIRTGGVMDGNYEIHAGSLMIEEGAAIRADGRGAAGGTGGAGGTSGTSAASGAIGGAYGSSGGAGGGGLGSGASANGPVGGVGRSSKIGAGAGGGGGTNGAGGNGGGHVFVTVSGSLTMNGDISANGANGVGSTSGGGGGGGGSVVVDASAASVISTSAMSKLTARGGSGYPGVSGGGGGGYVEFKGSQPFAGSWEVSGGTGYAAGVVGTVREFPCDSGTLTVNCLIESNLALSTPLAVNGLWVKSGAILSGPPSGVELGITASGLVKVEGVMKGNLSVEAYQVNVYPTGVITADGMGGGGGTPGNNGDSNGAGHGGGGLSALSGTYRIGGGGGGAGASGGMNSSGMGAGAQPTPLAVPVSHGGGGGSGQENGGSGGGHIKIVAQESITIQSNGRITANGGDALSATSGGGGGGGAGSVALIADSFVGSGRIEAKGGIGKIVTSQSVGGGGGGGGMVLIKRTGVSVNPSFVTDVTGGLGSGAGSSSAGANGTVQIPPS